MMPANADDYTSCPSCGENPNKCECRDEREKPEYNEHDHDGCSGCIADGIGAAPW